MSSGDDPPAPDDRPGAPVLAAVGQCGHPRPLALADGRTSGHKRGQHAGLLLTAVWTVRQNGGNGLFNDTLNTFLFFYFVKDDSDSGKEETFYLMTHSTHFYFFIL